MMRMWLVAVVAAALIAPMAMAETYRVSDYPALKDMLENKAEPGDVIEVDADVLYADAKRIDVLRSGTPEAPIVVRGILQDGKRPRLCGIRVSTQRAMVWFPETTHDVIVENLEICHGIGTRHLYALSDYAADPNYGLGAEAMNLRGTNLTVRNCYVHDNGGGFFAPHDADYILIENCELGYNGVMTNVDHAPSHHFYFCAKHQIVKDCYMHDPQDGENFKSRGEHTILAYNWIDEDYAYSIEQCSGGSLNTLWLGNVVAKRTTEGLWQGRVFAIGDGTGVVSGKVVAVNNTFVSFFPRDYFLFSFETGTADIVLINNVFAGPAEKFAAHNGKGTVTGSNNWLRKGVTDVPAGLENTVYGEDPGFVNYKRLDLRLESTSALIDAGAPAEKCAEAIEMVLAHSTSGTDAKPSPTYLAALEDIKAGLPTREPIRKSQGSVERKSEGAADIGAFEYHAGGAK